MNPDARHSGWLKGADAIQPLIVDHDAEAAKRLGDDQDGTAILRGGVLNQASCKTFIQDAVYLFRDERVYPVRGLERTTQ